MVGVIGSRCRRPPGFFDFCMTVMMPMPKSTQAGSSGRALPARRPLRTSQRAAARKSGRTREMMSASASRVMSITLSSASGSMSSFHAGNCTGSFQNPIGAPKNAAQDLQLAVHAGIRQQPLVPTIVPRRLAT